MRLSIFFLKISERRRAWNIFTLHFYIGRPSILQHSVKSYTQNILRCLLFIEELYSPTTDSSNLEKLVSPWQVTTILLIAKNEEIQLILVKFSRNLRTS